MGLVTVPQAVGTQSYFARLRQGIGSTNSQDDTTKTVSTPLVENDQLQQQLTRANEQLTQIRSDVQQLRREMAEKSPENTQLLQQLTHANEQWARANEQLTHSNLTQRTSSR